ncbi:hypothetical protein EDEG_03687 [Edhazardia aedis USNM 41457]|uniref:Uncharacterized protein n=1 Tax=Edhazardia aedis (strain USNM 41457) TaxID=1003232 RepID=J9DKC1_EDHAE|nr:hypothetical protein EDEG_03687 [Edhazardia aedis USNM 41457]|eukprot:EJW01827.1 hypothetical protein EDEG_03687 [Edhazardia aedis USNM 41457]
MFWVLLSFFYIKATDPFTNILRLKKINSDIEHYENDMRINNQRIESIKRNHCSYQKYDVTKLKLKAEISDLKAERVKLQCMDAETFYKKEGKTKEHAVYIINSRIQNKVHDLYMLERTFEESQSNIAAYKRLNQLHETKIIRLMDEKDAIFKILEKKIKNNAEVFKK